jgi:hypothetical protein
MKPTDEKQAPALDTFGLRVRIMKLGKTNRYFADKLNRSDSAVSQALKGGRPTLARRIERHVVYLENRAAVKNESRS